MRCAVAVSAMAHINNMMTIICLIYSRIILGKGRQHQCQVYQLPAERSYLFSLQAVALVLVILTVFCEISLP